MEKLDISDKLDDAELSDAIRLLTDLLDKGYTGFKWYGEDVELLVTRREGPPKKYSDHSVVLSY